MALDVKNEVGKTDSKESYSALTLRHNGIIPTDGFFEGNLWLPHSRTCLHCFITGLLPFSCLDYVLLLIDGYVFTDKTFYKDLTQDCKESYTWSTSRHNGIIPTDGTFEANLWEDMTSSFRNVFVLLHDWIITVFMRGLCIFVNWWLCVNISNVLLGSNSGL